MIGEKIKSLRKARRLTQEQLAELLSVSSQAVSKWETGLSSPNLDMLPRLAAFFRTSVDDLLDFDRQRVDEEVSWLVEASVPLRREPEKAEAFYREALKKYPGNEALLTCLLRVIPDSRSSEKIEIGERLLDCTADDDIRRDILRLLALTCRRTGEQATAEHYLHRLLELCFLKTEITSAIFSGEERLSEIQKTENVCMDTFCAMLKMRADQAASEEEKESFLALMQAFLELLHRHPAFHDRAERTAELLKTKYVRDLCS